MLHINQKIVALYYRNVINKQDQPPLRLYDVGLILFHNEITKQTELLMLLHGEDFDPFF